MDAGVLERADPGSYKYRIRWGLFVSPKRHDRVIPAATLGILCHILSSYLRGLVQSSSICIGRWPRNPVATEASLIFEQKLPFQTPVADSFF